MVSTNEPVRVFNKGKVGRRITTVATGKIGVGQVTNRTNERPGGVHARA